MTQSNDKPDLEQRIIALEEGTMHNERLLAHLNEVVCEIQDRLDKQALQLQMLKESLKHQKPEGDEERSFEDERPPHY